ncbi:MAG: SCO family protein [Rhodospirillales bacterium]
MSIPGRRTILAALSIVLAATVAGAWLLTPAPAPGSSAENGKAAQAPSIGGPFSLVDQTGKPVTDKDFRGRFMLVFFGYTYCPDVCPTDLQIISQAMDALGAAGEIVQPIFITVDPERDTPEVMADYVGNFHPRLLGLTGTRDQVATAAKAYRVYFSKFYPPPESLSGETTAGGVTVGEDEDNSEYFMNHSAITYLMGPDGRFREFFSHGTSPDEMAGEIRRHINGQT